MLAVAVGPLVLAAPVAADPPPSHTSRPPTPAPPAESPPAAPAENPDEPSGEPYDGGVGIDPACAPGARDLGAQARARCKASGSIAQSYPTSHYGLDVNTDPGVNPLNYVKTAIQLTLSMLWMVCVYVVKLVLQLVQWAVTMDIYQRGESEIERGLNQYYALITRPWMGFAIAVAGIWGIYNGLVRLRITQTLGALAVTVAMMTLGLVVITQPRDTIGYAVRLADRAAFEILATAASGTVDERASSFADAQKKLFDTLIVRPWCALQFADVDYCLRKGKGDMSIADAWLTYPAQSKQRAAMYRKTAGREPSIKGTLKKLGLAVFGVPGLALGGKLLMDDLDKQQRAAKVEEVVKKDPQRVRLQENDGTLTRFALGVIVLVGLLGAIALFISLGCRLLAASIMTLALLLLLGPVILFAPAFGDAGRKAFVDWLRQLAMALAVKVVFALIFGGVVLLTTVIASLGNSAKVGLLPTWALLSVLWWMLFLRLGHILGMLRLQPSGGSGGGDLSRAYHGYRMAREFAGLASRTVTLPARRAYGAGAVGARHARREWGVRREATSRALRDDAQHRLSDRAREAIRAKRRMDAQTADRRRARLARLEGGLRDHERRMSTLDGELESGRVRDGHGQWRFLTAQERAQREAERARYADQAARTRHTIARQHDALRHLDTRPADAPVSDHAVREWIARRRDEVRRGGPADEPDNLLAAGIDPRAYGAADAAGRQRMLRDADDRLRADRTLLERTEHDDVPMRWRDRREAMEEIRVGGGPLALDAERRDHRRLERTRRRLERTRRNVYR